MKLSAIYRCALCDKEEQVPLDMEGDHYLAMKVAATRVSEMNQSSISVHQRHRRHFCSKERVGIAELAGYIQY